MNTPTHWLNLWKTESSMIIFSEKTFSRIVSWRENKLKASLNGVLDLYSTMQFVSSFISYFNTHINI